MCKKLEKRDLDLERCNLRVCRARTHSLEKRFQIRGDHIGVVVVVVERIETVATVGRIGEHVEASTEG